jgi:hypothetical protein
MAKANIENTTSLTRRGAFALIAAAPSVAVPIVAGSSYPLFAATPDPIFAAIETFMHVQDAAFKACKEHDDAEHQFMLKYGASTPDALNKEVREKLATVDRGIADSRTETHEQIARCSRVFSADVIAAMHQELDRQTAVYNETIKPLELAATKTWMDYSEAGTKLLNTVPTTAVGVAAVLAYVGDNLESVGGDDEETMKEFLGTIAKAAAVLAGLPV